MDPHELRKRINEIQGSSANPSGEMHKTANFLAPLLGFLNDGLLGTYGESLGCNDPVELMEAANKLKKQLQSELSEQNWKTYFGDLKK